MNIPKLLTGLITPLFLYSYSNAQNPSQKVILDYIKSKTMILYMADNSKPDIIREIKPGSIESATGNLIFGKSNNNSMDICAVFLRDLLTVKNGDTEFQQAVYDLLKKSDYPIVLFFMNDVAAKGDRDFLRQNHIAHYESGGRWYIWPASYRAPDVIPNLGKRWAFVYGEYFNKDIILMKEAFLELFKNVNAGNLGQASQGILRSQDPVSSTIKNDKDIPKISSAQQNLWIRADLKQLGIIGNDFDGEDEIGTAPVERKMKLGLANPQFLNFWYPNIRAQDNKKAWKRTLVGKMKSEAEHFENDFVFPDHDIDFYVIPDKDYEYLIKENPPPSTTFLSSVGNLKDLDLPNCPPVHDHVEGEIDLRDVNEKQFLLFFNDQMKKAVSAGFYGTWMYDRGHCDHPEIHPAEQIWWSYRTENVVTYRCNLVCDYSDRYISTSQMDDEGGKYTIKEAWAAPPVKGVFAIAFTLKPGQERLVYRIFHHDNFNLNANKTVSFDKAKVHHYILNDKKVITVMEPEKECVKVSFDRVAFDNAGNLTGFIVLTSAVGQKSQYPEPGHLFFEVKKSVIKGTSNPPGKLKISLESIECTGVDEGKNDDTEEIFGMISCKAFSVKDTITYRSQKLRVAANTGAAVCKNEVENLFCNTCPNWVTFKKNQKISYTSSFTYDFPSDGYIEVTGDLDEADSNNCRDLDYLGQAQKTYILTNEIGSTPYRFTQFFGSGKTIIKANFSVQRVR